MSSMFPLKDHDDEVFDPPQSTATHFELHKTALCMFPYQCRRNTNGYDAVVSDERSLQVIVWFMACK